MYISALNILSISTSILCRTLPVEIATFIGTRDLSYPSYQWV